MLPTGELLIRRVEDADKYRTYQCRAMNRLSGTSVLSSDRAGFTVTGKSIRGFEKTHTVRKKTYTP